MGMNSTAQKRGFEQWFLTPEAQSIEAYQTAIATVTEILIEEFAQQSQPYSGLNPKGLGALFAPLEGSDPSPLMQSILNKSLRSIAKNSIIVNDPACIAHLHCPPLIPALAAEVLIAAMNQSMDSWDQSPAATVLEQQLTDWLCRTFGYDANADGIFTSGGTQSNFMGLLLARDNYAKSELNWSIQQQGLPPEANRFRILCSEVSHFTIRQSAALLGLGQQAVVTVETDEHYCLSVAALERKLAQLQQENLRPIALVATVGTTDFGSIDPLPEMAALAHKYGVWFHVDAAYGGALILSDSHSHHLKGIEWADSITVDFHKLFYQPISCGAFLLKNRGNFELMKLHADYLNPESNESDGIPDLVTKSVQTTRRFDGLKLWLSLQTLGQEGFAAMIDATIELAKKTARLINSDPDLELANFPTINAVVFRYASSADSERLNVINQKIRKELLHRGKAVIAQTQIHSQTYLKFTLLNPRTTLADISTILTTIKQIGETLEKDCYDTNDY